MTCVLATLKNRMIIQILSQMEGSAARHKEQGMLPEGKGNKILKLAPKKNLLPLLSSRRSELSKDTFLICLDIRQPHHQSMS